MAKRLSGNPQNGWKCHINMAYSETAFGTKVPFAAMSIQLYDTVKRYNNKDKFGENP